MSSSLWTQPFRCPTPWAELGTSEGLLIITRDTRIRPLLLDRFRSFAELNAIDEPLLIRAVPVLLNRKQ